MVEGLREGLMWVMLAAMRRSQAWELPLSLRSWALHNYLGHPMMQFLADMGYGDLGEAVHRWTAPHGGGPGAVASLQAEVEAWHRETFPEEGDIGRRLPRKTLTEAVELVLAVGHDEEEVRRVVEIALTRQRGREHNCPEVEMADVALTLLAWCSRREEPLDFEGMVKERLEYNKTRDCTRGDRDFAKGWAKSERRAQRELSLKARLRSFVVGLGERASLLEREGLATTATEVRSAIRGLKDLDPGSWPEPDGGGA